MKRRFVGACAIIVFLLTAALAVDAVPGGLLATESVEQGVSENALPFEREASGNAASSGDGAGGAARRARLSLSIDAIAEERGFNRALPADFIREAFDATGFDDVLVASDPTIIGLIGKGSATETFSCLASTLAAKGWVQVESGQNAVGTFVKEGGSYGWLLLACSDAGDLVSVVVHVR